MLEQLDISRGILLMW